MISFTCDAYILNDVTDTYTTYIHVHSVYSTWKSLSEGKAIYRLKGFQNFFGSASILRTKFHRLFAARAADKSGTINLIFLLDI